jgi:hypothetical protein
MGLVEHWTSAILQHLLLKQSKSTQLQRKLVDRLLQATSNHTVGHLALASAHASGKHT